MDQRELTPNMLVRKAILLQCEDEPKGTPMEIESTLQAAIALDDRCIEAYVELGRYYYAVVDDSSRAKAMFLRAFNQLRKLNEDVVSGLLECDAELYPERDARELLSEYKTGLFGFSYSEDSVEDDGDKLR
ncbi:MAG TPA: hypothetical protein PKJ41_12780 [Bryobacteraceae bacterium]|nr:hypothetical protein [Bryobacteraceae bacterium]HPT26901.1 hypothetical protein [Bryobacteraceae bacterium]